MPRNENEWKKVYQEKGAFWHHDGNMLRPHPILTFERHSDSYTNSDLVLEDPVFLEEATVALVDKLSSEEIGEVDRVVGPAMGGITLAHDIARQISLRRGHTCLSAYAEKEGDGKNKALVFKRRRIQLGERILVCEDVFTSGGSVNLMAKTITSSGGIVLPFALILVNSSQEKSVDGRKINSLLDRYIPTWMAEKCHLCRGGSQAIRPKGKENWERLNEKY